MPAGAAAKNPNIGMTLVFLLSLLALIDALFNYFWRGNGIHGTEGALLVIVSTLLMALAAGVIVNRWGPRWGRRVLEFLLLLDFIGTAAAGYFLEAWVLLALVGLSFIAWLVHFARPSVPSSQIG